jgi:ribose 5-phosphate isomerase RpiB
VTNPITQRGEVIKPHTVGLVSVGHVMNVEEASQNRQHYSTTAICMSLKAIVFRLDKDIFNTILKATPTYAQLLLKANY